VLPVAEQLQGNHEANVISPWQVLVWRLDFVDKRMDRLDERFDRLAERVDEGFPAVRSDIQFLNGRFDGSKQNYLVLQLTSVLGFVAILVSIWLL